jgi:hypothetical protein
LYGRKNVSVSAFPWSFQGSPWKTALLYYFISLQNLPGNLLCNFLSQQLTENSLQGYILPTEHVWGLKPQPSDHMPYPLNYEA